MKKSKGGYDKKEPFAWGAYPGVCTGVQCGCVRSYSGWPWCRRERKPLGINGLRVSSGKRTDSPQKRDAWYGVVVELFPGMAAWFPFPRYLRMHRHPHPLPPVGA